MSLSIILTSVLVLGWIWWMIHIIGYIFLSGDFWVNARHYEFLPLCAEFYFIPVGILGLCSGVQLGYMKVIYSFCVLLLWFLLWRFWVVVILVLRMLHCHDLFFLRLVWHTLFPSLCEHLPWSCCSFELYPFAPQPWVVLCACAPHYLADYTGSLCAAEELFSLQLTSLVLSPGTLAAMVCPRAQDVLNRRCLPGSAWASWPCVMPNNCKGS